MRVLTEARIAAMQLRIQHEVLAIHVERFDAELRRVRADHERELHRLTDPQGPFVKHLRDEVEYWRVQFGAERQRAEIAIDQCRAMHQGIGPVSLPPRTETARQDAEIAAMFKDPELASMGLSEGVG